MAIPNFLPQIYENVPLFPPDHMTVIQTMIIYIGCGSNMCNLIWLTCRPCGVPIENQRGQGGGLRLFWNRVIKTTKSGGLVPRAQWTTQHCMELSWATIIRTVLQTIQLLIKLILI